MTLVEQLLRHLEAWLDRLDRERDVAMRVMKREGQKPHLTTWIDRLNVEREQHCELIRQVQALAREKHPALILTERPRHATNDPRRTDRVPRKAAS